MDIKFFDDQSELLMKDLGQNKIENSHIPVKLFDRSLSQKKLVGDNIKTNLNFLSNVTTKYDESR